MSYPLLHLMERAASLAVRHRTHPNPAVGAVIVAPDGSVIGEGAHTGPGNPHAEVEALAGATEPVAGTTMIVTLEPCSHHDRTPPCTDAIIEAGIARVIIGGRDPDSRVAGHGVALLEESGITVIDGIEGFDHESVDPAYFHHRRTGRPLITLKTASTLDGQVAAVDGTSRWITGEDARTDGHRLRSSNDAIMVGAGTLIADDPRLTVRTPDADHQPMPVVVTGGRPLPTDARLWARPHLIIATEPMGGHDVLVVDGTDGRPHASAAMTALADRGYLSVLVEGGPTLAAALLAAGLIDRIVAYVAPAVAGGTGMPMFAGAFSTLEAMTPLAIESVTMVGTDLKVTAKPRY